MESLVGAGGWGYFDTGESDSLATYARAFPFVEVNSTHYEHPDPRTVAAWRRRVPTTFRFAVRAHRELTHGARLRPTAAARESLARTARIARELAGVAVVLETPESYVPSGGGLEDLLASVDLPCPVALEVRGCRQRPLPADLVSVMETRDVADAVDFSREAPRTVSTIAYGRLFGLGIGNRWEFTDGEMEEIRARAERGDRARAIFTFHGVRMYKDSGRFLTYLRTGAFPPATRHRGLRSLEEVLGEAATFPASQAVLERDHGFRVVDSAEGHRVHADTFLSRLPPGWYSSPSEVVARLRGREATRG